MSKAQPTLTKLSVINDDGSRRYVHPADVRGRFTRLKPFVYSALILVYAALPWIKIDGRPAVLLDIPGRSFFLFGAVFNAQDFHLAFFIITGVGFLLIILSALVGRVWCGWACPQTVFLEGVFRKFERFIDGPREKRLRDNASKMTPQLLARRVVKYSVYLLLSLGIAHIFVSYFVSLPGLFAMMSDDPREHWATFTWTFAITAVLMFNFSWFREQTCLIICPYGRLQSALQDDDTLIVGYDAARGEPRGKAKDKGAADCIDCRRCVAVCPTGIDIRNGLQMECIGCASCIDACDEIMDKLGRPRGLIRYDSQRGLTTGERRFIRPRVFGYLAAGLAGIAAFALVALQNPDYEANVLRVQGAPFVVDGDDVRNQFMLHIVNKRAAPLELEVRPVARAGVTVLLPQPKVVLTQLQDHQVPVIVTANRSLFRDGRTTVEVEIVAKDQSLRVVELTVLGPR